ncbi:DUF2971 domain-containing protein [Vibrio hibernica]|uniref:DUF2971 domain-containing protein n=1 Tax=Vibrio hibernica TaxID=2587465 RepID=UPI00187E3BAE|nr:DUF2971 domain-containing protein [Vibrio hibernica]
MSIQALTNLKSQAIYFNSPLNFNDPFDCRMDIKFRVPYIDEVPYILKFLREELKDHPKLTEIESQSTGELAAMGVVLAENMLKERANEVFKSRGVCCFSESNDNLLMWSHYASSAKGFCLEFDTDNEHFGKLLPVEYLDNPPELDYRKIFSIDGLYFLKALFCTKSSNWSYEKEWRALHSEINKVYHYPKESLTGVYFGPEADQDFLEIICLIIQGQNPEAKFYKGTRSKEHYKVTFEEVNYTPHILANA